MLDLLEKKGIIDAEKAERARKEMASSGRSAEAVLTDYLVSKEDILKAKSEFFGLPFKDLSGFVIDFEILKYISEESALHYKIIPLYVDEGSKVLEVGIVDPSRMDVIDAVNFISAKAQMPFNLVVVTEADFEKAVQTYRGISGEVTEALTELESELAAKNRDKIAKKEQAESQQNIKIIEDAPVTKIVATILHYATEGGASDIHIEPMPEDVRVRFRVDGTLNTSLTLPKRVLDAIVARVKILSNMRLDEKRKPQDGRFSAKIEGRKVDFRVSTFPAYFGEKVVMRILDSQKGVLKLQDMGLSADNLAKIRRALDKPYGLILVSGPTGSGKSTTLYSMLNELDFEKENGLSLEDPVEYNIPGMNQSQVRAEIGYTFASGLRTTLRQDPDIIMVGEIRDKETAQLAVQAALTGHMVFSTIHTNNAAGVIPRLIDMGVDPYLISPTLILAMAQRLVGKLHPPGKAVPLEGSIGKIIEREFEALPEHIKHKTKMPKEIYEINPTPECPRGVKGRTAVFEILEMDKELERVIMTKPTEDEVVKIARSQGMLTMKEDALLKVLRGEIPFEEASKL